MPHLRRLIITTIGLALQLSTSVTQADATRQIPLSPSTNTGRNVSTALFAELEELARIVDISYCVGLTSFGISRPFTCLSRCADFPSFELVTTWNTGPLLSDSCGYIALDHGKERLIVAFRGTYSIANTVVDLSTIPQEYEPYPGEDGDGDGSESTAASLDGVLSSRSLNIVDEPICQNCTVHMGFRRSWANTRTRIWPDLQRQRYLYPHYKLHLVGHSLGGAVAALAGLDLLARGWDPTVTTFGEPRVGNQGLATYINARFDLIRKEDISNGDAEELKYHRVTHIDDPVPLLPLGEWGYAMHAGEIFISKSNLSPDVQDLQHCKGDNDPDCMASQDSAVVEAINELPTHETVTDKKRDLLASVKDEVYDVLTEPWGIPSRYKLWQLFFAHRDYFWRLGLCVPGGDSTGGGGKYDQPYVGIVN